MPTPAALSQFQQGAKKKPLTFQQQVEARTGSPTGIKPRQPEELMITDITPEASNEQQKLLGQQARQSRQDKLNAARAKQAQKLVAAQNPQQEQNPNMPPKRQVPANAPPPKQPPQQPNQLQQMSQQAQQQRQQTQQALQQQAGSQQKRANWQKVLQNKSKQVPIQ